MDKAKESGREKQDEKIIHHLEDGTVQPNFPSEKDVLKSI